MKTLILLFTACTALFAQGGRILARLSAADFPLTADPQALHWIQVRPTFMDRDRYGKPVPFHRTEVRARWTQKHLYFLMSCPYEHLHLKPNPKTEEETNRLWEYDVAEIFAGADLENIHQYREFQVSPQGEWVDLDIDTKQKKPDGWKWNSGMQVKARVDAERKVWYGEMKIPIASIDPRPAVEGNTIRINFYRIQGPPPKRVHVNWQPVRAETFHTPEAFGQIVLSK